MVSVQDEDGQRQNNAPAASSGRDPADSLVAMQAGVVISLAKG